MDGVQILLAAAAAVGILLVAISFFIQGRAKNDGADGVIKNIGASIEEADSAAEELHKLAGSVMEELDNKYQELLFLYNLIDEKKKESRADHVGAAVKKEKPPRKTLAHPRQQEIMSLVNGGSTVAEIAKKLGMGQGEVSLILELGR